MKRPFKIPYSAISYIAYYLIIKILKGLSGTFLYYLSFFSKNELPYEVNLILHNKTEVLML